MFTLSGNIETKPSVKVELLNLNRVIKFATEAFEENVLYIFYHKI